MLVWEAHKKKVRCLAFSPDGTRLASAAEAINSVRLWEPTSGNRLGELRGQWGHTTGVAFSPDGKHLATATGHGYVVVWDAEARKATSVTSARGVGHGLAFAPDGSAVVAVRWGGVALWRDPATPRPDTLAPYSERPGPDEEFEYETRGNRWEPFDSVAFSPDGRLVAANGGNRAVVWDRETGAVRRDILHGKANALTAVTFAPDGERLAFSHGKLAEIHPPKGAPVVLKGHTLFVRAIGFTPDGRTVMTASSDGTVRFWNADTGAETRVFDWGIGRVYSAAFAPGGLTCAAGGEKGQIVVWDVDT